MLSGTGKSRHKHDDKHINIRKEWDEWHYLLASKHLYLQILSKFNLEQFSQRVQCPITSLLVFDLTTALAFTNVFFWEILNSNSTWLVI